MEKSKWKALVQAWKEDYLNLSAHTKLLDDALRPFADAMIIEEWSGNGRADWILTAIDRKGGFSSILRDENAKPLTVAHLRAARKAIYG